MAEEKVIRKKQYAPDDDKDWRICGIRIEDAENGVSVECCYELKPEVKAKIEKGKGQGLDYPYYGQERENYVFNDYADAKEHILNELNQLWNEKGDDDGDEDNPGY